MSIQTADVIVIGLGAMGGAAFQHLAERGVQVTGFEQHPIGHAFGSSHGETRIIRKAYFEHPDYVPLLVRAYELWSDLEASTGQRLYHETGLLIAGPGNGDAVPGARLAAGKHGIAIEEVASDRLAREFPWIRLPGDLEAVFEPEAGYLEVERCVELQVREGERHGGRVANGECVVGWSAQNGTVEVRTDRGLYSAAGLVVAAGPWASRMLADAGLPLEVVRKPVAWFPHAASPRPGCGFFVERDGRAYYGIPSLDDVTTKVAEHTGGQVVEDPSQLDRELQADDLESLQSFLTTTLPGLQRKPARSSVCMYTLTPDRHFLIDLHPAHGNVAIACGFSGHGFKFAAVIGEILADLATTGTTTAPIHFLRNRW